MNISKNVVMLPTEEVNAPIILMGGTLHRTPEVRGDGKQHIYVYDDSEIEKYDFYYSKEGNIVFQAYSDCLVEASNKSDNCFKVVSTTDDGLQIQMIGSKVYDPNNGCEYYGFKSGVGLKSHLKWKSLPNVSESFIKAFIKAHNNGTPIVNVLVKCMKEEVWGNNGSVYPISYVLKISKEGNIIIHQAKKYTREEVTELFRNFRTDILPFGQVIDAELNEWCENNL